MRRRVEEKMKGLEKLHGYSIPQFHIGSGESISRVVVQGDTRTTPMRLLAENDGASFDARLLNLRKSMIIL